MTDARFPERWLNDRRLVRLDDSAFRLFIISITWSVANKTDGEITMDDLPLLPYAATPHRIADLVQAGLWEVESGNWRITDFEVTQTTREQLEAAAEGRRKARDKKRRQRAAASVVPRDVPRDNTRPGQDRPGQAPRNVVPGKDLAVAVALGEPEASPPEARNGATPSQSLRDHDGPEPDGPDVKQIPIEVHLQSQAADRNAREACPVCGLNQQLRINGKLARHGPKFTPCRGSGMAITATSS